MAVIDPDGLFQGERLRRCSDEAQLHWPRLYLASDGFARLELNYARIIGRAYPTFHNVPTEAKLQAILGEFASNFLLYIFEFGGTLWGQWDTAPENLPRYKTAADRKSPTPPEPDFTTWKKRYREQSASLPKSFQNLSETFLKDSRKTSETFHADAYGVGVGVGVGVGIGEAGRENFQNLSGNIWDQFQELYATSGKPLNDVDWSKAATEAASQDLSDKQFVEQVIPALRRDLPNWTERGTAMIPFPANWLRSQPWTRKAAPRAVPSDDYPELTA